MSYENFLTWIREIPDHLKLQGMCNEAFDIEPFSLAFIPDHFKTQEICQGVVEEGSYMQMFVSDHYKTKMCEKAVKAYPWLLWYVPDWFVVLQEMWCEDFDDIDYLIGWRNAYQKRKAQKTSIKLELIPIAWHPDRVMEWRKSEGEKRDTEALWG